MTLGGNMKKHNLKIWPEFFEAVYMRRKTFEVRKNDRNFNVGDTLIFNEFNPETEKYTGAICHKYVRYIMHGGKFGIEEGYCVMGIE